MQTGEFTGRRLMVAMIRGLCNERNITFSTLSDDWVIEMTRNGRTRRSIGYSFSLNDAASALIAKDKVATHLVLKKAVVPSVPHVLLRQPITETQLQPLRHWGAVVVKPLEGTSGQGVKLVKDYIEAVRWIEATEIAAWAAAPFIALEREIRCILLDGVPLLTFEKQAVEIDGLKMFNLSMGALPREYIPDESMMSLAAAAQRALGLRLCAVDIVETTEGERMVLEVNSGFMMEHFMRFSSENEKKAKDVYGAIIDAVMEV